MSVPRISCVVGDDHALMRTGLAAYLRATEHVEVLGEAANGDAVLTLIERCCPDTAVLDVHMDKLTGIEVCRSIVSRGLPTKVLLYTGDDDLALLDEALEAGAVGYVIKSGPLDDLVRAIDAVIAGDTFIEPSMVGALLRRRSSAQHSVLSGREQEVLVLLAEGLTTDEIGQRLYLSPATVRSYSENAMHKLGARNRPHLVAMGLRQGLLV